VSVRNGFAKIRAGLEEHLVSGRIGFFEAGAYLAIHLQADFRTGVWIGSAPRLLATAPRGASLRSVQRALERLVEIQFLRVFHTLGSRGNYRVLIHKYEPQFGALRGKRLNAFASVNWRNPVYELVAERDAESDTEPGAESDAEDAPYQESLPRITKQKSSRAAHARAAKAAAKRAIAWPEGFALTEQLRQYAIEREVDPAEWDRFENHHRAKGSRFVDWERAWYTWVDRSPDFRNSQNQKGAKRAEERTRSNLAAAGFSVQ
jgi:hypothetical protein